MLFSFIKRAKDVNQTERYITILIIVFYKKKKLKYFPLVFRSIIYDHVFIIINIFEFLSSYFVHRYNTVNNNLNICTISKIIHFQKVLKLSIKIKLFPQ